MHLYEDNKFLFDEIQDVLDKFVEYGHVYEGYKSDVVKEELLKIQNSLNILEGVLDDNYGI